MIMRKVIGFAALISSATLAAGEDDAAPTGNAGLVAAYVEAHNARDLETMLDLMHKDVQWLSIEGSEVAIFANGKADLGAQMEGYLASPNAPRSEISSYVVDGRFVSAREIASWKGKDGKMRSQSALAVYEFEDGLVRRVWYYPSTR